MPKERRKKAAATAEPRTNRVDAPTSASATESAAKRAKDAWTVLTEKSGYEAVPNLLLNAPQSVHQGLQPRHIWVLMKLVQLARLDSQGSARDLAAEYRPGRVRLKESLDQFPLDERQEIRAKRGDRGAGQFGFLSERAVQRCVADLANWGLILVTGGGQQAIDGQWTSKRKKIDLAPLIARIDDATTQRRSRSRDTRRKPKKR